MKKTVPFVLVSVAILFFNSCRKPYKDVNDYFPKIKLESAILQTDGTVLLKGKIESEGASAIEYLGFCYGTKSTPKIVDNQIALSTSDFTTIVESSKFDIDSTYYFRAWAANGYGYSQSSNILSLDSIIAAPVIPPCNLSANYVKLGSSYSADTFSTIGAATYNSASNSWDFTASAPSTRVKFSFGNAITTGVYSTRDGTPLFEGQVIISFTSFYYYRLQSENNVYVNTIGHNTYEVTICEVPWVDDNGITNYFNAKFTVNK